MRAARWMIFTSLLWCGLARADSGIRPEYEHPTVGLMGGFGAMVISPNLGNDVFSGNDHFASAGRELGLHRQPLLGGQFRVGVLARYFEIGPQVIFGTGQSNLSWIGVGGHVLAVLPLGPMTLTFGPDVGVRSFSVPIIKDLTHDANATQVYVEPVAGLLFNTKPFTKFGSGFFLHLWAGGDVYPGPAFTCGLTVGGAMDHNRMR